MIRVIEQIKSRRSVRTFDGRMLDENIKEKLSLRNFNKELYENGIISEKTSTFNKKDVNNFANCFDREIQKKLRLFIRQ